MIDNYFKNECDVNTSIKEAFTKGFEIGLKKAPIPQPKTGHWIFDDECKEHGHCSYCGYGKVDLVDGAPHNYCPNYGCRMVEP